ncbi:hypothetical protein DFJ43DRAFT_1043055 [Lentinula guzmanii]|uniref:Uncharacterized protein n=1 Tax=Lentinula guzmanii TaxID=2804957 RepID=A0AA38MVK4_9AGAR|nr:hypothetical protein DFJ43DRAFT_1043055 [Lentinula guzmanii]
MDPGPSTRKVHMPFDDFTRTQAFSFSPTPVSKPDTVVWQMPPPSNPALQTLIDKAKKDVYRARSSHFDNKWSLSTDVADGPVASSSSRSSTRAADKRVTSYDINPEIAQLVDPVLLKGVADIASQKAQERSRALGLVMKRKPGSHRSTKVEKSTTGKSRVSRAVHTGMIEKTGSDSKRKEKGKGKVKEKSNSSLFPRSSFGNSSAFRPPIFDDGSSITTSSTSSSPKVLDNSISMTDNSAAEGSLMSSLSPISASRHPSTKLEIPSNVLPSPPEHRSCRTTLRDDTPTIILPPSFSNDRKPLPRPKKGQDVQMLDASTVIVTASSSSKVAQLPTTTVVPPSMSHPRPSANPPALGMRRVSSLPVKNVTGLTKQFGVVKDLPTKQRPFKTPFLPTNSHAQIAQATFALSPKRTQTPEPEPDGMSCDEAETSYEHDSFDMDALEDMLKQYD